MKRTGAKGWVDMRLLLIEDDTALCAALEQYAAGMPVTVHASVTARPFFEKHGYRVCRRQQVLRAGVALTNFVMEKSLGHAAGGA